MNGVLEALVEALGPDKVSSGWEATSPYIFDQWVANRLYEWLDGERMAPLVVRPASLDDVRRTLWIATQRGVPVVPFGLGSGVCGGIETQWKSGVVLDMGAMNAVRFVDRGDLLAGFDAGCNGLAAEQAVAAHGLTTGHWPQSIAISSVGGWVSTRASGQFSTAYGNIEDIVHSIEAVLPTGEAVTLGKAVRAAAGPDLRHLLMGAEGTMGVVTGVTLNLREQPEHRDYSVWFAADMDAGFAAQRRVIGADWRPPVMRQYDGREVRRLFREHSRDDQAMLMMVHEGPRARVEAEMAAMPALTGLAPGDAQVARDWMERRNHVPSWPDLFKRGYIADTVEISGRWSQIGAIYRDAIAALNAIPDIVNASAHSSHVYRSGISLYFSFAGSFRDSILEQPVYRAAWDAIMAATVKHGGGIAHHHGIGQVRRRYLHHDLGDNGVTLLRRVKAALDPAGIMNPSVLIPRA